MAEKKPSLLNRYIMKKTGASAVVGGLKNAPAKPKVPAAPRLKPAKGGMTRAGGERKNYLDTYRD